MTTPTCTELEAPALFLGERAELAEVLAAESCGEGCHCAMYADDWPMHCYRPTPLLTGGKG